MDLSACRERVARLRDAAEVHTALGEAGVVLEAAEAGCRRHCRRAPLRAVDVLGGRLGDEREGGEEREEHEIVLVRDALRNSSGASAKKEFGVNVKSLARFTSFVGGTVMAVLGVVVPVKRSAVNQWLTHAFSLF